MDAIPPKQLREGKNRDFLTCDEGFYEAAGLKAVPMSASGTKLNFDELTASQGFLTH